MNGCNELRERLGLQLSIENQCCGSCHDEWDGGYGEPMEDEYDGKTWRVCCAMSRTLESTLTRRQRPSVGGSDG